MSSLFPDLVLSSGTPETGFSLTIAEPAADPAEHGGPELTLSHTSENGTLLTGSSYGDGAYDALKAIGQRWRSWRSATDYGFPAGTLYVQRTRDKAPNLYLIDQAAEALRAKGFVVCVEVDGTPRDQTQVRADKRERLEDRADALGAKARRIENTADARAKAADEISQRWAAGQPIILGHHSTRKALRDREKMDGHMRKSVELAADAELTASRAEATRQSLAHLDSPIKLARWIDRAEADRRGIERGLNGSVRHHRDGRGNIFHTDTTGPAAGRRREQLLLDLTHLDAQLEHARELLAEHVAAGRYWAGDVTAIKKDDRVLIRGEWMLVEKVNPKTIRVHSRYMADLTYPHLEIRGHRPAQG